MMPKTAACALLVLVQSACWHGCVATRLGDEESSESHAQAEPAEELHELPAAEHAGGGPKDARSEDGGSWDFNHFVRRRMVVGGGGRAAADGTEGSGEKTPQASITSGSSEENIGTNTHAGPVAKSEEMRKEDAKKATAGSGVQ
eukprot:TRINITY_DN111556_c0_g1_i1.p2 TRINITY_DN111556_c0_g1~~TRINITY_DN111556_c0_g1_i1.p2  ORF type:complete len:144 (-),score=42.11 TRINITY_DN111556_c0_g1_i1:120-551(-)